jgi:molecular chaperone DnaJ
MDIKQAFAELGLNPQASRAEARAAYRTLAMRWHPDVNSGMDAETRMKAINVAYASVCHYLDARAPAAPGVASSTVKPASGFSEFDWKTGFKSANRVPAQPHAECVQRTIRVSLFEAAFGCIKRLNGMVLDSCPRCSGRGVNTPVPPACPTCRGSGKTERRGWTVDVPIYAGTLDGTVVQPRDICVHAGGQGLPHSFKLTVQLEKHPLFKLDQNRLSIAVPISVWRWALGGEITVPTLNGSTRITLPTKPAVLLVKNQGWPAYKALEQRGPLFVMPKIVFPEQLRVEERRMLELLEVRSHLPEVQGWSRHVQAWTESSEQDLG